ncbi:MAG: hypothetical protein OHK0038_18730 [Flammeovirgaceae bacterium]
MHNFLKHTSQEQEMADTFDKTKSIFKDLKAFVQQYLWQDLSKPVFTPEFEHRLTVATQPVQQQFMLIYQKKINSFKKSRGAFLGMLGFGIITGTWVFSAIGIIFLASSRKKLEKIAEKSLEKAIQIAGTLNASPMWQNYAHQISQPTVQGAKRRAKDIKIPYDPSNPSIESLQKGFMVDYDLKTWDIVHQNQFDWDNGAVDRLFKAVAGTDTRWIYIRHESGFMNIYVTIPISVFAIDENLEKQILETGKPSNILKFKEVIYYRENMKEGYWFDISNQSGGTQSVLWEYFDSERNFILRIEQIGKNQILASVGKVASPYQFTDILPKAM